MGKTKRDELEETVAGGQGQDVAVQVGEGKHVIGIGAMPTAVNPLSITEYRYRPFAPNLNLNGIVATADVVFQDVGVFVVGGEEDDIFEAELLIGVGVEVGLTVGPAGITAVTRPISPGHICPIVANLNLTDWFAGIEWLLAESHTVLELGRRVLAALVEDET